MRIAMFTDAYLPQTNGVVIHIVQIASLLASRGHELLIFAARPARPSRLNTLPKNIKVHFIKSGPLPIYHDFRFTPILSPKVLNIVRKFNPDIIHFHTPLTVGANGIILGKMLNIPVIGTFHTFFMEPEYLKTAGLDKVGLDKNRVINKIGWLYNNMFYNSADLVISPSQFTRKELLENGVTKTIKVIKSASFTDIPSSKNGTKILKLPKKYFVYVGRVSQEKSLDILIEAFHKFALEESSISLVIVGDGPATDQLKALIKKYDLKKRVRMLGAIPHKALLNSKVFKDALAFVSPSKSENQPVSMLEAMTFGLPIIGVAARGVPELISQNGILCRPDNQDDLVNSFAQISSSPDLRKKYSKGSLRRAREYSSHKMVAKMEQTYAEVIKKYRRG